MAILKQPQQTFFGLLDLSAEERLVRATKEKDKGNEAFRAQDYDEAVVYYTNSLKYEPTAASYNNRAAAGELISFWVRDEFSGGVWRVYTPQSWLGGVGSAIFHNKEEKRTNIDSNPSNTANTL